MPRLIATACLVGGLLHPQLVDAADGRPYGKVAFYFAAHEDDWQLFMNPSAFEDVASDGTKVIFVHLTAGDAGLGAGTAGRKYPYYLARENGAQTAIRFMADSVDRPAADLASAVPDQRVPARRFSGHLIYRVAYRNTVAYFLRVADGHPTGSGFDGTGHQSLERLAAGRIERLSAVDGSTTYEGWADLVTTLRAILDYERERAPALELNMAELDPKLNPNDHSDHLMTARAAIDAAQGLACARRRYFVDYASSHLPENLSAQQRDMEASVLAVTAAGILARDHGSIWKRYFQSYLGRNYFRVEPGRGRCDEPSRNALNAQ